jgi:hypothetical protein
MDAKGGCALNHAQKECTALKLHTSQAAKLPVLPGFSRF